MRKIIFAQIGKNGMSESFIENLKNNFKKNKIARISVLKSARENGKKDVEKIAEEITKNLKGNYKFIIIGFVIVLRRVGNPKSILKYNN